MSAAPAVPADPAGPVTLRPATPADVPLVRVFIEELADYERLRGACVATDDALRATLFGPHPYAHVVVAEVGGAPAGFALYYFAYSTFLAAPTLGLEDLYVRPAHRGHGVGRHLLAHLAAEAVRRECGRMEWSVLDWNADAIAVYRRIGARPRDGWTVYRLDGAALAALAAEVPPTTH